MNIYELIEQMDKGGDLGNTYRVDPKAGTVERSFDPMIYEYVIWDGKIEWPEGLDYRHEFHPSENLYAKNWEWHLKEFVADGIPFRIQTEAIMDYDSNELVGWVLMVKVDDERTIWENS